MTLPVEDAKDWIEKAQMDLKMAQWLKKGKFYEGAAFHCQQAAEKSLKALIAFQDFEIEKTHDIVKLIARLERVDSTFGLWREAGRILTPYAVQIRYPGDSPTINAKKCTTAIKYADAIYEKVLSRLPKEIAPAIQKPNRRKKKHIK